MRKARFWKTDWFLGVIIGVSVVLFSSSDLIPSLERKAYDSGADAISHNSLYKTACPVLFSGTAPDYPCGSRFLDLDGAAARAVPLDSAVPRAAMFRAALSLSVATGAVAASTWASVFRKRDVWI